MKIDTKKLAEYSKIEDVFAMIAEWSYRLSYPHEYNHKTIELIFDTMQQWTPDQVDELFDENGDLNQRLLFQAGIRAGFHWSNEQDINHYRTLEDCTYKRVMLVQLCRWLVREALLGIFNDLCIFNLKDTMIAHHSGFAGSYEIPTDLVKLTDDFVSKEFILNAFDSETCWIEFE